MKQILLKIGFVAALLMVFAVGITVVSQPAAAARHMSCPLCQTIPYSVEWEGQQVGCCEVGDQICGLYRNTYSGQVCYKVSTCIYK